ncbi:MAG: hypothetical protein LiPW39_595, partial [Parcubacteria group bacterium LiPW_39]
VFGLNRKLAILSIEWMIVELARYLEKEELQRAKAEVLVIAEDVGDTRVTVLINEEVRALG